MASLGKSVATLHLNFTCSVWKHHEKRHAKRTIFKRAAPAARRHNTLQTLNLHQGIRSSQRVRRVPGTARTARHGTVVLTFRRAERGGAAPDGRRSVRTRGFESEALLHPACTTAGTYTEADDMRSHLTFSQ